MHTVYSAKDEMCTGSLNCQTDFFGENSPIDSELDVQMRIEAYDEANRILKFFERVRNLGVYAMDQDTFRTSSLHFQRV